ncbi:hypothetical protein HC891_14945 [Candidatus Gracilibacteria bacterium]|nr:hypothetical protein [Candidatus Gracilibacteria bacterium]
MPNAMMRRSCSSLLVCLVLAACTAAPSTNAPAAPLPTTVPAVESRPVSDGPLLLRAGTTLRKVIAVDPGVIRLVHNPADGALYLLNPAAGVFRLADDGSRASLQKVADLDDVAADGLVAGLAIGPDGTLFVVSNRGIAGDQTQATVRRGVPAEGSYRWTTLARSEPYPLSGTPFDHLFNGVVVSPDGAWLFVNSGSRTDHGEVEDNDGAFPGVREVPLTAKLFRLPADGETLLLPADGEALRKSGYVYADGLRNAYDLAFAPNGDLFAAENGPDADFPDELNWIRAAMHYGFPWKFGAFDNPQQFPDYDPAADKRLPSGFTAVDSGTYRNDPTFPPAPATMQGPLINSGPAATQYRDETGAARDAAAEGEVLVGITPHRSPLGLVFATGELPPDLQPAAGQLSAFVVSWGAAGGTLTDVGRDVLHLMLRRTADGYEMSARQIAAEFENPIDAVLLGTKLYVLEHGTGGAIWELTFE